MIRVKRTYEPAIRSDGRRILVERLWPRGMKKESLAADAWMKDVAPSTNPAAWQPILDAAKRGTVTLLYSARDTDHNGALVLRDYLCSGYSPE